MGKEKIQKWIKKDPGLESVSQAQETLWINPRYLPFDRSDAVCQLVVSDEDIQEAAERLDRFAPLLERVFPETRISRGRIESELVSVSAMKSALESTYQVQIPGRLLLKLDSDLPIAGSVKARGGIYEVLKHAEDLAISAGKLSYADNYAKLADPEMKNFFHQYTIQVGSTGNLGLSIGIMSAALGMKVKVHMSSDARVWKKDLLRKKGAEVIEYAQDYSRAVAEGRALSAADPLSYFVDDERSVNLFVGYAVAAKRLEKQLSAMGILVDADHPLFVYIPAGVGGAPGGISYGLKRIFKDHVHCFFVEPTQCPSVLLGMATQEYEKISVQDFGLSGITEADGLACASSSSLVTRLMTPLLSGIFTVSDARLFDDLRLLFKTEGREIEPSSCAAFIGPTKLMDDPFSKNYCQTQGLGPEQMKNATHIAWATGGSLVPKEERKKELETYL